MKKSLLIITILFTTLSAFGMHRERAKSKPAAQEIVSLTMHRTACFGRCPDYMITLNKGGMVSYTGIMFVEDSGVYSKQMDATTIQNLLNQAETYRIDTCKATYPTRITDIPGIVYTVQYKDNHTQQIMNANFGPDYLKEIARNIDDAVKVDNTWHGKANAGKK